MNVRAKMSANNAYRGQRGAEAYFSAVYEGSAELQKISENSMFGDATPSGNLSLIGDFAPEQFQQNPGTYEAPEFYIDLIPPGSDAGDFVLKVPVRKAFQSVQYQATSITAFRFVSDGALQANLYLGIINPKAVGALDAIDHADMVIRVCDGRRSEAEIAVLEKMLAQEIKNAEIHGENARYRNDGESLEHYVERFTRSTRRKLARAKGEA